MAIVTLIMGLGLAVAAWRADTTGTRLWFGLWAVLNLFVTFDMIAYSFEYRWTLQPAGEMEPAWRADRR